MKSRATTKLGVLALGLLVAVPVCAYHDDSNPQGLRVTVTSINNLTVNFDVTLLEGRSTPSYLPIGLLGTRVMYEYSVSAGDTYDQGVFTAVNFTFPQGIEYGDGGSLPSAPLAAAGGNVYRGSFSHTYAAPGTYTIRVFAPQTSDSSPVTSGNRQTTGALIQVRNLAQTYTVYLSAGDGGGFGLTNTSEVTVPQGVPTMSRSALLVLGLLLLVVGVGVLATRQVA